MEFGVDLAASVMVSLEGERVPLLKSVPTVPTEGKVEVWLSQVGVVVARARGCATTCVVCGQVEAVMKSTMASCVRRSLDDLSTSTRTEWAQRWPGSVVLAVSDIVWTSDLESALRSTRLSFQGAVCRAWSTVGAPAPNLRTVAPTCRLVVSVVISWALVRAVEQSDSAGTLAVVVGACG